MNNDYHDLFLEYGNTLSDEFSQLPLILVVGREPNNPHPFRSTIGKYPLEAKQYGTGRKRTVAFWDQSYGTIAKTAGMDCASLKTVARRVNASPILFTDAMPIPATYAAGSDAPRRAREETDERAILEHHENIFSMQRVVNRVSVVVLAGHRHGSFSKRERQMLEYATESLASHCSMQKSPIATIETKSMYCLLYTSPSPRDRG